MTHGHRGTVIVPLSFASLATGLVQSLGTTWGLFRHWWVLVTLVMTVLASAILLMHMLQPLGHVADAVSRATLAGGELHGCRKLREQRVAAER